MLKRWNDVCVTCLEYCLAPPVLRECDDDDGDDGDNDDGDDGDDV